MKLLERLAIVGKRRRLSPLMNRPAVSASSPLDRLVGNGEGVGV